jgi:hypothetical protein
MNELAAPVITGFLKISHYIIIKIQRKIMWCIFRLPQLSVIASPASSSFAGRGNPEVA